MALEYTILGYLSWKPMSGYDLKKLLQNQRFFTGLQTIIRYIELC